MHSDICNTRNEANEMQTYLQQLQMGKTGLQGRACESVLIPCYTAKRWLRTPSWAFLDIAFSGSVLGQNISMRLVHSDEPYSDNWPTILSLEAISLTINMPKSTYQQSIVKTNRG